jgi:hypothetical protein
MGSLSPPEEEGEQQRTDVRSVHIGVREDDHLVVPRYSVDSVDKEEGSVRRAKPGDLK